MSGPAAPTSLPVRETAHRPPAAAPSLDRFLEALRPSAMRPRLAAPRGDATCHVLDAKFEPGVRAIVLYQVGDRLVRGDVLPDNDPDVAAPDLLFPGVRCHWFPDDPELPLLVRVADPGALSGALARAGLRRFAGRRGTEARCRLSLLRYRPGKRATVLAAPPTNDACVVKAYHDPAKAAAVARSCSVLEAALQPGSTLRLAPTLAHVPDLAATVQGYVSGVPLDLLLGRRRGPLRGVDRALVAAARALAELHEMPTASTARERSVDAELRRFAQRAGRVSSVAPGPGAVLTRLAERLIATRTLLPLGEVGLVHGDCKPSQFLGQGEGVVLLDLDHVGRAEQAGDLGTFLASMRQLAVRNALSASRSNHESSLEALRVLFLDSYRGVRDASEIQVRWHEAVALERKALRAFARAPGSPMVLALTVEAHRCLDEVERRAGVRSDGDGGRR